MYSSLVTNSGHNEETLQRAQVDKIAREKEEHRSGNCLLMSRLSTMVVVERI